MSYAVETEDTLTLYHVDEHGEYWDMNAKGEPITDKADLIVFICDMADELDFSEELLTELITDVLNSMV